MTYQSLLTDLRDAIGASPFASHADQVLSATQPAVALTTSRVNEEEIPLGASKFGGLPHVPKRFSWPRRDRQPLMFLAQINLADVPRGHLEPGLLPDNGTLYFFYDVLSDASGLHHEDRGSFLVIYEDGSNPRTKRQKPPKAKRKGVHDYALDQWSRNRSCRVSLSESVSLDPEAVFAIEEHIQESQVDSMLELHDQIFFRFHGRHGNGVHRLFGHPDQIQGPVWEYCQRNFMKLFPEAAQPEGPQNAAETLRHGQDDWRLLLQIDSDDNADWMWGDAGSLYFCIREQDLRAWNFDRVWGIFECS